MLSSSRSSLLIAALMVALSLSGVLALDRLGRAARSFGVCGPLASQAVSKVRVAQSVEAYRLWRARHYRGRTVLFLGANWPKVQPDGFIEPPAAREYPLKLDNYVATLEAQFLDSTTFLFMATQTGVARRIIAVLPETGFRNMMEGTRKAKHVELHNGYLLVPYMGYPRFFATLKDLVDPGEPVLVYLAADFFQECSAQQLYTRLKEASVASDQVVLCDQAGEATVSEAARRELDRFAQLIGAGGR